MPANPARVTTISIGRLRRDRGISVARPTPLGNPYHRDVYGRTGAIEAYRIWLPEELERNPKARAQLDRIVRFAREGDVTLLCWCAPAPCHAEVVREYARSALATIVSQDVVYEPVDPVA